MDAGSCRKSRLKRIGIKIYLKVGCGVNVVRRQEPNIENAGQFSHSINEV